MKNITNHTKIIKNIKHRSWVLLHLENKLSISQIATLLQNNLALEKKQIILENKIYTLSNQLQETLNNYLKTIPNHTYLYPSKDQHISSKTIYKFLERLKNKTNSLTSLEKTYTKTQTEQPKTIGRSAIVEEIHTTIKKKNSLILLGPIGIGKTHLLENLPLETEKILYLEDCYDIKSSLIQCLLLLYNNDKEKLKNELKKHYPPNETFHHLQRNSIAYLTKMIIKLTIQYQYILLIDNLDQLTPKAVKTLEQLKDHFIIITAARSIPINKSSFLWNFRIIHVEPLSKNESLEFIIYQAKQLKIRIGPTFQNQLYQRSLGNPRILLELLQQYQRVDLKDNHTVETLSHHAPRKEYDLSVLLMLVLTTLAALRYVANETGNPKLKIIGSIALVVLIASRYTFKRGKKSNNF